MIGVVAWICLGLANYALLCWFDHKNKNAPSSGVVVGSFVLAVALGPVMWLLVLLDAYEDRQQRRGFDEIARKHRQATVSQPASDGEDAGSQPAEERRQG